MLVIVDLAPSSHHRHAAIHRRRALQIEVSCLPVAMRRIADLHPGNAKTDARDAFIIAEAGHSKPHALRRVGGDDELIADLADDRRLR